MHIDFRKNKTVIPPTTFGEQSLTKVRSYKLLGIWFDDDLNTSNNDQQTLHLIHPHIVKQCQQFDFSNVVYKQRLYVK